MQCPISSSQLTIDLDAICANYRMLADRVAPAECGAVVKADAYGLGVEKVAPALRRAGCETFFVAQLCEAFTLLDAIGRDSTIFILNGLDPDCEPLCASSPFVPVLNSASQVARWRSLARSNGGPLPAALQLDSGMSRLGLSVEEAGLLAGDPDFDREISLRLIMTHLACADEPDHPSNPRQLARFLSARRRFPDVPASIANSGGAFLGAAFHLDIARAGIALLGASPAPRVEGLRPAVRLEARIIQIREIAEGDGVGYGLDFVAPAPRRLATLGIGYADGLPRSLGGVGAASFEGHRLPIVGRVSMDSLTVDITDLPKQALQEGEFLELVGPSQSLDAVAKDAGTISYEVLTRLGARPRRIYVDGAGIDLAAPGARS